MSRHSNPESGEKPHQTPSPAAAPQDGHAAAAPGPADSAADDALNAPGEGDLSGPTIFGQRPIHFRNLTGESAESMAGDPGAMPGVFKIRLARSRTHTQHAGTLVQRRYASRGYQIPGLKSEPNLRTFVAYADNAVVGTLSLRVDSEAGLSADKLYREELSSLRQAGDTLCEFTRLAVEGETVSKAVLGALFHTAYLYAYEMCGRQYGVIEVNPRHSVFYRRGLNFEVIGPEKLNPRVNAPSVLLCVSFAKTAAALETYFAAGDKPVSGRSMYAHWFPPDEAAGVLNRLRRLESTVD